MYLTEAALDASVAAVRDLSAPGSSFAITYMTPAAVRRMRSVTALTGFTERFRKGWEPGELPAWLATRGFELREDLGADELARRYLPARYAPLFGSGRRIARVERRGGSGYDALPR